MRAALVSAYAQAPALFSKKPEHATHGTPSAWHTDGILGLVELPPCSSVTKARPIELAVVALRPLRKLRTDVDGYPQVRVADLRHDPVHIEAVRCSAVCRWRPKGCRVGGFVGI
jgi:hypothetical protein